MIKFNCHCSYELEVPTDLAGGLIQCPQCKRLNDVPTLSDLEHLEAGGIFKISETPDHPVNLAATSRAFTRQHTDTSGRPIDIRQTVDEFLDIGSNDAIPLALKDEDLPGVPRYDPETGQLIEPMSIKQDAPVPAQRIPVARRAIGYAHPDLAARVTTSTLALELFRPLNLFVMFCVVVLHALMQVVAVTLMGGIFIIAPFGLALIIIFLSHYGNVVDETGPCGSDELPRPLRNISWHDDLWGPFTQVVMALMVCFWPVWALWSFTDVPGSTMLLSLLAVCGLLGAIFFPAVLLTTTTSGSIANLRPDRLMGVIQTIGVPYVLVVIFSTIGLAVYGAGIAGFHIAFLTLFSSSQLRVPLIGGIISSPLMLGGIYLSHLTCWFLGMQYRVHHVEFPWVMQRHQKRVRSDTMSQLEERRRQQERARAIAATKPPPPPVQSP